MKLEKSQRVSAYTAHCSHHLGLPRDSMLKKFWDDWMALDGTMRAVARARLSPSFARVK